MTIEVGKTYEYQPHPDAGPFNRGRKALILKERSEDLYSARWPNGTTTILYGPALKGPVEPAKPGVDELCLTCGGTKEVEIKRSKEGEPWIFEVLGTEPCPNCGGGE